jgi:transposase
MFHAGIDAHAQYLRVAVLDKDGVVVADGTVKTQEPQAIKEFLKPFRPLRAVVESCAFWPWIRDQLSDNGVQFQLAHAKELRAIASHAQKNDAVDAHLLARMSLAGLIPPAFAHAPASLDTLRLVRHHAWLTRYRTMFANRIHSQLHQSGIQLKRETLLERSGRRQLAELAPRLAAEQRRLIRTHLVMIGGVSVMLKSLRKRIIRRARNCPRACLLQTIPGVGPYWGLLLSVELNPIERFASADHLVSYAGLAPITRASGGHLNHGPLPNGANRWLRGAYVAAAMSHMRHAPDSPLSKDYERLKSRLGWKKARIAIARKLARSTYHMMRKQQAWHA